MTTTPNYYIKHDYFCPACGTQKSKVMFTLKSPDLYVYHCPTMRQPVYSREEPLRKPLLTLKASKRVQTCYGCPSEWDSETKNGNYVYIRYRHGDLSVAVEGSYVYRQRYGDPN